MKNILYLTFINSLFGISYSQTGINTKDPKATLHVKANSQDNTIVDGIIPPSLTRSQIISKDAVYTLEQKGAFVYITEINNETLTPKTINISGIGYYYFDGNLWQPFNGHKEPLYLPSFNLPMVNMGANTFDLYTEVYKKQFTKIGNPLFVSSNPNLTKIPDVYTVEQLDFIVTYYDNTVIEVTDISSTGILSYTVLDTNPSNKSFINIILIIK